MFYIDIHTHTQQFAISSTVPASSATVLRKNLASAKIVKIEFTRKISNTICTLVQYATQTFTGEPWENVSLAVQYAPVLRHSIQTCSLLYIVLLSDVSYSIVHFFIQTNKNVQIYILLRLNQCLLCL